MVETALPKTVDRFDLGFRARLTKAKQLWQCKASGKPIKPGNKYYAIEDQHGVTPYPDRVLPEYLNQYFTAWEIRRAANAH